MHRVIEVSLAGHPEPFRMHEEAFVRLRSYLESARTNLRDDVDRLEVINDLEQSIGEKLAARQRGDRSIAGEAEVGAVLEEIGVVRTDDGTPAATVDQAQPRPRRRLYRIREGQQWAGVCTGLAAYAELDVSMVRWVFVLLGLVTVGFFLLVYVVAMFVIPVVPTRAAFAAAQRAPDGTASGLDA